MNGLIYGWRFADSRGYFKCGRKQEILETFWITGHSKRKKSAAWVGIPSPLFIGLCLPGLMRPIFFFFFFLQNGSFQVVVGLWQGGCSWLSPALDPGLGGGAVTMVVTVLTAISVVPWLLLPSSLPPVFYHQHLPHESGEASFACAQPPALRPQKPSLVCWHLASQGNILPTYFSISFLKVVLLNDGWPSHGYSRSR